MTCVQAPVSHRRCLPPGTLPCPETGHEGEDVGAGAAARTPRQINPNDPEGSPAGIMPTTKIDKKT